MPIKSRDRNEIIFQYNHKKNYKNIIFVTANYSLMAKRNQFSTRFGVIAATVGSAVGLGNIWRFPYEAGVHGGGAFLIINLLFVLILGIPVICAEFLIGRHSGCDVCNAFKKFRRGRPWTVIGWMGLTASTLILGFYSVVAGWTAQYIYQSLISFGGVTSAEGLHSRFVEFSSGGWSPLLWTIGFLAINFLIVSRGVEKGIEKISNILMPVLFILLLAFTVNSLTLAEAGRGLEFLFKPDFSEITPSVVLGALGQAFFSLSLGLGCLITYASYFKPDVPLVKSASLSALLDTMVAIMAGVIIFPAVFTFGQEPAAGPQLVFEVLPSIFCNMGGGMVWSTLFFVLLFVASLTSTLSLFETTVAFLTGSVKMKRLPAVGLTMGVVIVLATLCSLSFGPLKEMTLAGKNFFDISDYFSSNILLPLGGMLISIFVGWVVDRKIIKEQFLGDNPSKTMQWIVKALVFSLRFVAPTGIGLVFLFGISG